MVSRNELRMLIELINQDTKHLSYKILNMEDLHPGKIFGIETAVSETSGQMPKKYAMKIVDLEAAAETVRHNKKMLQRMQDFSHPNIIQVLDQDAHRIGGRTFFWFVMELGEEKSLDDP
ncbi:hypothetical protein KY312_02225, partial [Candidatus Woesearchaeota archaeon]|nr:hypothetical protein [Candidatus Woesearchaeota archaeon]